MAGASGLADQRYPKGSRIFVGNLHPSTTVEEVIELYSKYGVIQERVSKIRHFAFVQYKQPEFADAAIKGESGKMLHGWPMEVRHATSRWQRQDDIRSRVEYADGRGKSRSRSRSPSPPAKRSRRSRSRSQSPRRSRTPPRRFRSRSRSRSPVRRHASPARTRRSPSPPPRTRSPARTQRGASPRARSPPRDKAPSHVEPSRVMPAAVPTAVVPVVPSIPQPVTAPTVPSALPSIVHTSAAGPVATGPTAPLVGLLYFSSSNYINTVAAACERAGLGVVAEGEPDSKDTADSQRRWSTLFFQRQQRFMLTVDETSERRGAVTLHYLYRNDSRAATGFEELPLEEAITVMVNICWPPLQATAPASWAANAAAAPQAPQYWNPSAAIVSGWNGTPSGPPSVPFATVAGGMPLQYAAYPGGHAVGMRMPMVVPSSSMGPGSAVVSVASSAPPPTAGSAPVQAAPQVQPQTAAQAQPQPQPPAPAPPMAVSALSQPQQQSVMPTMVASQPPLPTSAASSYAYPTMSALPMQLPQIPSPPLVGFTHSAGVPAPSGGSGEQLPAPAAAAPAAAPAPSATPLPPGTLEELYALRQMVALLQRGSAPDAMNAFGLPGMGGFMASPPAVASFAQQPPAFMTVAAADPASWMQMRQQSTHMSSPPHTQQFATPSPQQSSMYTPDWSAAGLPHQAAAGPGQSQQQSPQQQQSQAQTGQPPASSASSSAAAAAAYKSPSAAANGGNPTSDAVSMRQSWPVA